MYKFPNYDYFWAFLIIASGVPVLAISVSKLISPLSHNPETRTSYESGIEPMGESWIQFQICYYMFALVFVIFDVETIFLYPWAMNFDQLGIVAFIEILVFLFILIIGLIYAWRKGVLEWL